MTASLEWHERRGPLGVGVRWRVVRRWDAGVSVMVTAAGFAWRPSRARVLRDGLLAPCPAVLTGLNACRDRMPCEGWDGHPGVHESEGRRWRDLAPGVREFSESELRRRGRADG